MSMPSLADEIIPKPRIPRATYRLQFNAHFTFRDALAIVPYLDHLGISDCYASPILLARPGSQHGYDVCDPGRLNPELGTPEDFDALVTGLREHNMGLLLDTVPNHMGVNAEANRWWMDVLENGPSSEYAAFFDIEWHPIKVEIANKVLLPILGDLYGQALEQGQLQLTFDRGAFWLSVYSDLRLPIAPRTYRAILRHRLPDLRTQLGDDHEHLQELESIITSLDHLPPGDEPYDERRAEHTREQDVAKRRLAGLYSASPVFKAILEATIQSFNGTPGDPASFDLLDDLIAQQFYRPAFWRVAAEEINYRRFFDVNLLAAIQVEREAVFEATHRLIFTLLAQGKVTGLRIDHPDGLLSPNDYFRQLQERYVRDQAAQWIRAHEPDGQENPELRAQVAEVLDTWTTGLRTTHDETRDWPLYVVVEKILSEQEPLPADWPVFGTTGYDFLNSTNNLLIARENEKVFSQLYQDFVGGVAPYSSYIIIAKRLIMNSALTSEINALGHQLERITERNRRYRDYTLNSVIFALREVITYLQVYRTYIAKDLIVSDRDQHYITTAVAEAKQEQNNRIPEGVFTFIEDTLLLRNLQQFREADRQHVVDFVMKFQQVTGPVMAKSLEDTAFYIYNRLVSLNEVGGHPDQFGASVNTFHRSNVARSQDWPHGLLATSTHDTKRGEDVRARIDVLSEIPESWEAALHRWHSWLSPFRRLVEGDEMPSRNDEYLLYQTLIGIWPEHEPTLAERGQLRQRLLDYTIKAAQEAKLHTSWINPNGPYLEALSGFIDAIFTTEQGANFLEDFQTVHRHVAFFGHFNGLTQTLLKLVAPGVPDFYQGTELWEDSLVDPDNRRPVDYALRQQLLAELGWAVEDAPSVADGAPSVSDRVARCRALVEQAADGRLKLFTIFAALDLRRRNERLFKQGAYIPLEARGTQWQHVCAFARKDQDQSLIAVAPRLVHKLTNGEERAPLGSATWQATWLTLPDDFATGPSGARRQYRDCFTHRQITVEERDGVPALAVADVLQDFPIALLEQV